MPLQGEIGDPAEVAAAMLFLASSDSSYTNGEILTVDGGQSLTSNVYDLYVDFLKKEFE